MPHHLFTHLRLNPIFAKLDSYMFQIIEEHLVFCELQPDEVLFYEGQMGEFIAFVLVGELTIIKHRADGSAMTVGRVKAGESIGEMALLDHMSRSATAKAEQVTAIVSLSKVAFEMIIQDYPKIGVKMLQGMANLLSLKLRRTSEQLMFQQTTTA